MDVLISGGTGFIGRTLVNRLLEAANRVIVLTRDEKKADGFFSKRVEILEGDICSSSSLERLTSKLQGVDTVFHLASSTHYFMDKKILFYTNVEGSINLFKWAGKNGVKKFVFTSSIEAIGPLDKEEIPGDEDSLCRPVSTYGESKLEAENCLKKCARCGGPQLCILRLGNVYGPGSQSFIIPIANAILKNGKLLYFLYIYNNYYIHPSYIEDIVEGIVKAYQADSSGIYILAGEKYVNIGALFAQIAQVLMVDLKIRVGDLLDSIYLDIRKKIHQFCKSADLLTYFVSREGKRIHRAYSIKKARESLGYFPKTGLMDGIVRTIEWARGEGLLEEKK